jgi:putative two-component system response regulator
MTTSSLPSLLVVDDTPLNLDLLRDVLSPFYRVRLATSGESALKLVKKTPPDLILLDIMMPGMDGYAVCQTLKADPRYAHIPVIFVTAMSETHDETHGFEVGAVDYITKPISAPVVLARVKTHLALHNQHIALEQQVRERTEELHETRLQIIQRLGRAAEFKDNDTGRHVIRMSHYARIMALKSGVPEEEADLIFNAMPMHDIGKIGIPDRILLKPGPLNEEEWAIMRQHPQIGAEIIGENKHPLMQYARTIALTHHEKWDGSGYPNGLKGEAIPFVGRLAALADVFDALTNKRPYKDAWSIEKALQIIHDDVGKHFDPGLMPYFDASIDEFKQIQQNYLEGHNG